MYQSFLTAHIDYILLKSGPKNFSALAILVTGLLSPFCPGNKTKTERSLTLKISQDIPRTPCADTINEPIPCPLGTFRIEELGADEADCIQCPGHFR